MKHTAARCNISLSNSRQRDFRRNRTNSDCWEVVIPSLTLSSRSSSRYQRRTVYSAAPNISRSIKNRQIIPTGDSDQVPLEHIWNPHRESKSLSAGDDSNAKCMRYIDCHRVPGLVDGGVNPLFSLGSIAPSNSLSDDLPVHCKQRWHLVRHDDFTRFE